MNIGTLVAYKSVVSLNFRRQTSQESCDLIKRLQTTYSTYPFKLYITLFMSNAKYLKASKTFT